MTAPRPLQFTWDGRVMVPRYQKIAARQYEKGEVYPLEVREERSHATHNHYFACINEGWQNLPEHLAERFPTPDHLRKWLLIKMGFRDERSIVAASQAEALRFAAFVRPSEPCGVIHVHEATVIVYTAKSQSLKAMGKDEFKRSKDATLDALAEMLDTDTDTLKQNAGRAA